MDRYFKVNIGLNFVMCAQGLVQNHLIFDVSVGKERIYGQSSFIRSLALVLTLMLGAIETNVPVFVQGSLLSPT